MILGNSNGRNKGKKYLKKDKVDLVYAKEAESFNSWISKRYRKLVSFLQEKGVFDKDVFHETYKNIYEKILYSGIEGSDYTPYFMRAYYTNFTLDKKKESRFCELLPNTDKEDIHTEYSAELEEKGIRLESDIMNHIYVSYDIREFELFKMYITLKPAVSYSTLSEITGIRIHKVQRIISKIKKDIQDNIEYSRRMEDIL